VDVPEHDVRFPTSHEADETEIDASANKGHSAASAKSAGTDFATIDAQCRANLIAAKA
jgi:hypothetical protein